MFLSRRILRNVSKKSVVTFLTYNCNNLLSSVPKIFTIEHNSNRCAMMGIKCVFPHNSTYLQNIRYD